MCVKQNAQDHANAFPLAAKAVEESFYVDDGLTGADSKDGAIQLQRELQTLFRSGGFLLRKWNSSEHMTCLSRSPLSFVTSNQFSPSLNQTRTQRRWELSGV